MKIVQLFCDGSSLGNPGFGGYCGILRYKETEKIIQGARAHATNNQMELLAVIESLKSLKEPCEVKLFSDSSYVTKAINEWLPSWIQKDFAKVKNKELWQEYLHVSAPHRVHAFWVRGHNGHAENEQCDKIAKAAASALKENHEQQST